MFRRGVLVGFGAAVLAGCGDPEAARIDEARARLVGTWLMESESGFVKSRRVLSLAADGKFVDRESVATGNEPVQRQVYAGEWSYDGMNFKRRFLQENGRQYSGGKIRFATFPLVSVSDRELVLDDNIRGERIAYRRVADGTEP
jgi:hypothetical protein